MNQRPIGGLGIRLVIQKADTIAYEYTDGENVLTISFKKQ
jgi:anti-sigma regulatory factor (Ser/Thr protein kinase)